MIIFDTNAVNLLPPDGPKADIIRKLRESGHHRVAVPWMVLEELVAHRAKYYVARHQAVTRALDDLRDITPWELDVSLERLDLERIRDHWRNEYNKVFEVIETSGESARKALSREALALPPAKQPDPKHSPQGGRDVAIWFSILEFPSDNPDEHVDFVTNNHKDFSDGTHYPFPMDEDVRGMEHRLTRLKDFNEVVTKYTTEVSGEAAETAAEELLRSAAIRGRVAQTAVAVLDSSLGYVGLEGSDSEVGWRSWLAAPEVELLSVKDVTGHAIEGDTWYTANVQWLLYGSALGNSDETALSVACVWKMKVLFSTRDTDGPPTVLSEVDPTLPDTADDRCMKLLRRLKENVERAARQATRGVRGAQNTSSWAASIAQQNAAAHILASMPRIDAGILAVQRGIAEQYAAAMPKLDIPNPLLDVQRSIAEQYVAAMPKLDIPNPLLDVQRSIAEQLAGFQGLAAKFSAVPGAARADASATASSSDDADPPAPDGEENRD